MEVIALIRSVLLRLKLWWSAVLAVAGARAEKRGFVSDVRAVALTEGIVDIMVGVIIVGAMGVSAFNFNATNFSQANATVQVMLGTVVPMLAAIGIGLVFIRKRMHG
jgi:hypothetical protein